MDRTGSLQFVNAKELRALVERPNGTTVSIFHPTTRAAVEPEENSLHLKNLLREAEGRLNESGMASKEVASLLDPATALLEDQDFWRHQLEGLAVFLADQGMTYFRVPEEVPATVEISDTPFVKPLLSSVFPAVQFYILALSQNDLRLFHCSRDQIEQLDLSRYDIPTSLAESLQFDDLDEPDLQHHPTTGPGLGPVGEPTGADDRRHGFHGHGESGEGQKTQVRGHLQNVSRVLDKVLGGDEIPLVLAGVEWVQAMYRDVSAYRPILDEYLEGNPDGLSADELLAAAKQLVDEHRAEQIQRWKDDFGAYEVRGTASTELEDILRAGYEGRIARLFIERGKEIRGTYDPARQTIEVGDGSPHGGHDLYDLAAHQTLLTDGVALLLDGPEMPADSAVAAMFRW